MQSENRNKSLIRKYISGSCTVEEQLEIRQIMQQPDVRLLFDEVLAESWMGLEEEKDTEQLRLNDKLQLFYNRLESEEQAAIEVPINRRRYFQYAAIWAILILGLGTYGLMQYKKAPLTNQVAMQELVNPYGQRSKVVLPDGSEVYLGAGSRLSFPGKFSGLTREIALEGEAFFQVTKNPAKPFIVRTGSVQTRVLGTSFKIDAFKNSPLVVAVATGKVRVDDYLNGKLKPLAMLKPGQMVTYKENHAITSATVIEEVKSWKNAQLYFHNRSLGEIAAELERWYNVKISFRGQDKPKEKISVNLQADMPLNKIMKVLAATGHFSYQISAKQVQIN
jgi:ferric-dicitrate binding protein FerR (iron transport regulator)